MILGFTARIMEESAQKSKKNAKSKGETAVYGYDPALFFGSSGVVLMSCKVNFHIVRSALQNSMCLRSVYFCWSGLL